MDMKFGDKVKIKDPFYAHVVGLVVGFKRVITVGQPERIASYQVSIYQYPATSVTEWFLASSLEKVE